MGSLIMKRIILTLAVCWPALTAAQPSSQVAWTDQQLNFVKAGDPNKGENLAKMCSGCHGDKGISASANYPSLAGQSPTYLYKQLLDYKNGQRQSPMMNGIAKNLSEQDVADLAAWFGKQSPAFKSRSPMVYALAETLVKDGSNDRILPPCEVCHGRDGEGQVMDIPALSGQNAAYLSTTLQAFKSGERHNDIYRRMRLIAESLTDKEIEELGFYYQNVKN
jgi:cytochrome c553